MPFGDVSEIQPPFVPHGTETIIVFVGPKQEKYTVHKDLICAASEFFKICLSGPFKESADNTVHLPEEDPYLFRLVYDWLYSGRVVAEVSRYTEGGDVGNGKYAYDNFWWTVYLLGDRLMMDHLRVLAIQEIQDLFGTCSSESPSVSFINDVFDYANLPGLETYLAEHVIYWLKNCTSALQYVAKVSGIIDSHERFTDLAGKTMTSAKDHHLHHPGSWRMWPVRRDYPSPWKIAHVEPGEQDIAFEIAFEAEQNRLATHETCMESRKYLKLEQAEAEKP